MNKEEFLKLSDLDKVKYSIEESLKEHKGYEREYFKGSAAMGKSILQTIEQVKEFAITDVVKSFYCYEELDEKLPRCSKQCVVCRSASRNLQ